MRAHRSEDAIGADLFCIAAAAGMVHSLGGANPLSALWVEVLTDHGQTAPLTLLAFSPLVTARRSPAIGSMDTLIFERFHVVFLNCTGGVPMGLRKENALTLPDIAAFFENASGFQGIGSEAALEIAGLAFTRTYCKGETIFSPQDPNCHFYLVKTGLVKVSIYSASGFKLTYLLAEHGEPLNLVSPFTCRMRPTVAEALSDVLLLCVSQKDFLPFIIQHPKLIINAISILGKAVDSANLRIIDLIEKRVEERLTRVLYTLYNKFGSPVNFTSYEMAALTGTTPESTLRALGSLREKGIISSERGQTHILDPNALLPQEKEALWL